MTDLVAATAAKASRAAKVAATVAMGATLGCVFGALFVTVSRVVFAAEPLLASIPS